MRTSHGSNQHCAFGLQTRFGRRRPAGRHHPRRGGRRRAAAAVGGKGGITSMKASGKCEDAPAVSHRSPEVACQGGKVAAEILQGSNDPAAGFKAPTGNKCQTCAGELPLWVAFGPQLRQVRLLMISLLRPAACRRSRWVLACFAHLPSEAAPAVANAVQRCIPAALHGCKRSQGRLQHVR